MSLVNFTYGSHGLDPQYKTVLPRLFLQYAVIFYAFEVVFRGCLLRNLLKRYSWHRAFWIHLTIANVLFIPWFWKIDGQFHQMGFVRFWFLENLIFAFWGLLFLKTGSLIVPAFCHAVYRFVSEVILNDAAGHFETLYFYNAASDDFYWLMIAVAMVVVSLQVFINQEFGMKELNPR